MENVHQFRLEEIDQAFHGYGAACPNETENTGAGAIWCHCSISELVVPRRYCSAFSETITLGSTLQRGL